MVTRSYYPTLRERGGCLSFWLGLNALAPVVAIGGFLSITGRVASRYETIFLGFILIGIAYLVFCIATWNWKRWGVYGLFATIIVSNVFSIVNNIRPAQNAIQLVVQSGILFLLVAPKWDDFD